MALSTSFSPQFSQVHGRFSITLKSLYGLVGITLSLFINLASQDIYKATDGTQC